jgi:hypothetical protein
MAKPTEPRKWYIAVDCPKCGEAIRVAEAPSPGEAPDLGYRTADLECLGCGYQCLYPPGLMTRRRC